MKFKLLSITLLLTIVSFVGEAQTTFASPFSDNMVLQRNDNVKIWGRDNANTPITVTTSWNSQTYNTTSDSDGKWSVAVSTPEGSYTAYTVSATGTTTKVISNVLIGEVWMCSGQSNMEMAFGWPEVDPALGDAIVASATDDKIRGIRNNRLRSLDEEESFTSTWITVTGNNAKWFSMVAYYYAKKLREELGVPIGLINNSYGGSNIRAWMDTETASQFDYITIPTELTAPEYRLATVIYNAAVHPWLGFRIKGVLWYQGEADQENFDQYAEMLPAMVNSWRQKWGIGDFPFYYVQVVPYANKESSLLGFWNMMRKVHYEIPNSGVVVTLDHPSCDQIHPSEKQYVGDRLAYWALAKDYGKNVVCSGPLATSVVRIGNTLKINFDYAETGLVAASGGFTNFQVAGADQVYYNAQVQSNADNSLTLSSASVPVPQYARYGAGTCASLSASLFNGAALPASPFIVEYVGNTSVSGVSVTPETATLAPSQTLQLTAIITPLGATTQTVTWLSSHPSVASVDPNTGFVTAVAVGAPVTITATTADGGFTDTSIITVENSATPDDIMSITGPAEVLQGETITVSVPYSASTDRDIVVNFQENGVDINGDANSFTSFGSTRTTVLTGEGTLLVDIATSPSTPISSGYRYAAFITTVGGGFAQRLASGTPMTGVSVTEPLSTSTFENQMYSIYPNPVDDFIQVEIPNASFSNIQFRLYDLLGKLVLEEQATPGKDKWQIKVKGLSKGIHVLEITTDNNQMMYHKLIKK